MRYHRQICLPEMGLAGQEKLQNASVAVVGAGGMGSPVLQYLAAAGVGRIGIIDDDVVEESNLHRQVIYGSSSLGKKKAIAAGDYLANLNPKVKQEIYPVRLTSDILSQYDYVVDCSDNLETRYLIDDSKKPWIYGAIHRYEGQVAIFHYKGGKGYRDLFPHLPLDTIPDCTQTGVLGVLPGITGMLQATECLKLITGIGEPLLGEMLVFNLLTQTFTRFQFAEKAPQKSCPVHLLSAKEFRENKERYLLIDVRELDEEPPIPLALRMPLSTLRLDEILSEKEIAFVCKSGKRSNQAALLLAKTNRFQRVYAINEPLY